jgi:hypothetical protein
MRGTEVWTSVVNCSEVFTFGCSIPLRIRIYGIQDCNKSVALDWLLFLFYYVVKFLVTGCLPLLEYIYIYIYTYHTKFAAYMVYSSITFFHNLLVSFFQYIQVYTIFLWLLFCMLLSNFVNYVVWYFYCYVYFVLCILFHFVVLCIICV